MRRIALWLTALLFAHTAAGCPLAWYECKGVVSDPAQLGADLARLERGERVIESHEVACAGCERATQISGSLVVMAPPDAVWAVLTDFASWPRFVPNLADVSVAREAGEHPAIVLRQHTRVFGFGFSATTRRQLDAERRIVWDQLVPGADSDVAALSGFWQVLDLGGGRSLLRFQSRVALAGSLPHALESWLIERGAPDALEAFGAEIERRQHAAEIASAR
jgi:ribosome-associated toxin RatA of RatAB toxin-antitoxin module